MPACVRLLPSCGVALLLCACWSDLAAGQAAFRLDFEETEPSWVALAADAPNRVLAHVRTTGEAHGGLRSEYFRFVAGAGSHMYLHHALPRAVVREDLRPAVWIKSDRAGVRLMARIVFPRAVDPQSSQPLTTTILGPAYARTGDWEELILEDVPLLVERAARVLRLKTQLPVSVTGAYLDQLVLNVYTGPGPTSVWIDDASLNLTEPPQTETPSFGPPVTSVAARTRGDLSLSRGPTVEWTGRSWERDERPFFPRVIEYSGETLGLISGMGCSAIRLSHSPNSDLLNKTAAAGLGVICPPPELDAAAESLPILGDEYSTVWAWQVPIAVGENESRRSLKQVDSIRATDARAGRPVVAAPEEDYSQFSRAADFLILPAWGTGNAVEQGRLSAALDEMRPGVLHWAFLSTDIDVAVVDYCGVSRTRASPRRRFRGTSCGDGCILH